MTARLLPIACILMGALMILVFLREVGRAEASRDWPTVDGRILSSDVARVQAVMATLPPAQRRNSSPKDIVKRLRAPMP